jgi:hypothetical protein
MRLDAHEAIIKTATVEIKSLTVTGRQVTLSVFRQLQREDIIDRDTGELRGQPWGRVNYAWNDCGWSPYRDGDVGHQHVVWQLGEELRRACVETKPTHIAGRSSRRKADELLSNVLAYQTVKHGWKPTPEPLSKSLKYSWSDETVLECRGPESLFNVWKIGPQVRTPRTLSDLSDPARREKHRPTYLEALVVDVFPDGFDSYNYDDAVVAVNHAVEQYLEVREHYHQSLETLGALDQLFIAA